MIIAITGKVTDQHVDRVRSASARSPDETLTLLIDSPGGGTKYCLAVADLVDRHRGLTIGRAVRRCDSGAVAILASCDTRLARVGARFLVHATGLVRAPAGRLTAFALREAARHLDASDRRFRDLIAQRCGCSIATLAALEAASAELDTARAMRLGLLTHVIMGTTTIAAAPRRRPDDPPAWYRAAAQVLAAAGGAGLPIAGPRIWTR
jgi:ATP-dependent protease ClpP protease subunit